MNPASVPPVSATPFVMIADDDDLARDLMVDALSGHHACLAFPDAESLLASPVLAEACCVVSDILMGGMSGIELQARLAETVPWVPVLLVTGHAEVDTAVSAMKNGAFDFLRKPVDAATLCERVAAAQLENQQMRQCAAKRALIERRLAMLTPREIEMLESLADGLSAKEIARQRAISVRTVEHHRESIIAKLEVGSLRGLIHFYARWQQVVAAADMDSQPSRRRRLSGSQPAPGTSSRLGPARA